MRFLGLLFGFGIAFGFAVAFFERVGFAHVFPLFRLAIKTGAFLVIHMRLGVDPDETVPPTRGRRRLSDSFRSSRASGFGRSAWRCG